MTKLKSVNYREELPLLLNDLGLTGVGVEIGVQRGEFSRHLLQYWKGKKLYLVDSWHHDPSGNYRDIANGDHNVQLNNLAMTFMNIYEFKDRPVIIREASLEAAKLFADQSLDFVFIDADHAYEPVKADIAAWYPKLKPNGVLSGHDYLDSTFEENNVAEFGVKRAVDEWAKEHNKKVYSTTDEAYPFWWIHLSE